MKPCERCCGSGCTPRIRRRREDGSPDPSDILGQHREICDRCGDCGELPANPPSSAERQPGFAADLL
jgi:hypothetical protein